MWSHLFYLYIYINKFKLQCKENLHRSVRFVFLCAQYKFYLRCLVFTVKYYDMKGQFLVVKCVQSLITVGAKINIFQKTACCGVFAEAF